MLQTDKEAVTALGCLCFATILWFLGLAVVIGLFVRLVMFFAGF